MKHIVKRILSLAILVVLVTACSSLKITSDKDPTVDFTQFKTYGYYGWAEGSDKLLNDLDKRRIESAFGDEFAKRGLKYVESDYDMIVVLFIVTQQKTQTTATTTGTGMRYGGYGGYHGYGPGYGWGVGMNYSTTTYSEHEYTVGTLIIDIYDAKGEKLIWEATGIATIKEDPKGREDRIKRAVAEIMKQYPVAPASE